MFIQYNNMKVKLLLAGLILSLFSIDCGKREKPMLGKIKRETIALSPKVTGRILRICIREGVQVKPGDTLAMLDVPEVNAKIEQARGAVRASSAQHLLADNGYTSNQLKQLRAKYAGAQEQFAFAQKSYSRANSIFNDSLLSPQAHDEAYAKYQAARAQLDAVTAELNEAERGTRFETKLATLGQQEQAKGLLQEVQVAYSERFILATNYMTVETITLHEGELATAGYPVFSGYIPNSTWFRFTVPESKIAPYKKDQEITIYVPYNKKSFKGRILTIKQLPRYADITTAYPDYEMDDAIYEIKIAPEDEKSAEELLYNATITLWNKNQHN
jgi:HlyD family secretion protein